MKTYILMLFLFLSFLSKGQHLYTRTNEVVEWSYSSSKHYSDPFNAVDLWAEITNESGEIKKLPAFWAGENMWSFRFSCPETGMLNSRTVCNEYQNKDLNGKTGTIEIISYKGINELLLRGSLNISADKRHLEYADGTQFFWLADSWWHGMTKRFKWPEDFLQLIQDRKQKGFSVIQFAIAFPCDNAPFDPRGMNEAGNSWDEDWHNVVIYFDSIRKLSMEHFDSNYKNILLCDVQEKYSYPICLSMLGINPETEPTIDQYRKHNTSFSIESVI
jgi:hypothetical protein